MNPRNSKLLFAVLTILMVLTLILAGCGGREREIPDVPAGVGRSVKQLFATGRKYYSEGVEKEANLTVLWREYEQSMNAFRTGARDLISNAEHCYSNVATTESTIAEAVMGNMDMNGLFNGLMTQSVSGEAATSECTQLNQRLADYIVTNRQAVKDKYMSAFDAATDYQVYTSQFPEVDIMNDLMQTYLDTTSLYAALAENGIGVTDWSWLPTANLMVSHSDEDLCRYYINGEFMENIGYSMKMKFVGHEDSLYRLYESTWNPAANQGRGECRMTRYAALEYMTRNILSSDTRDVIESGEDQGIFDSTGE